MGFMMIRVLGFFFVMVVMGLRSCSSSSQALKFNVGGKNGWVLKPSEDYNHWAERNRFQVNDTLFFKYKKGSDSVLVVTNDDYDSCNTKNPIQILNDGDSTFKFDRSGPFFFISGNAESCQKGQRLIIVVLAVRDKPHQPPSSPTPFSSPPVVLPSPKAESPKVGGSPQPSRNSSDNPNVDGPAPTPSGNSASTGLSGSFGLVLGIGVGVSLVLGSFVGMV
ncbi:Early nodulin-like protein [Quillaja saponaria]|uniref:Early nodulin-like protein n=1 Tax=Quillaja saponaria TaxID=32244 RepID=A0AAD7QHM9_QUISA|nr:Early nodulin-like protein [Quillaja saponaria]